ncbi:hypothetical protein PVAP13_1KG366400 [Panicum virgatum]|uniref:Uncharacterized protein n=1 Tax=Panicum virgatum TaxID=38727 RepID=A0A8T0XJY2_PANVG|nr:hypothetical protein PVAP13_1KG366400 [Panicum virgatum]
MWRWRSWRLRPRRAGRRRRRRGCSAWRSRRGGFESLRGAHLMPRRREGATSQHPGDAARCVAARRDRVLSSDPLRLAGGDVVEGAARAVARRRGMRGGPAARRRTGCRAQGRARGNLED